MKVSYRLFYILFTVFLGWLSPATAQPRELHVAKSGNDGNAGTIKSPFLTLTKASEAANPGDKIIVHKGTYREQVLLRKGGLSEQARITFMAARGEEAILKGSERITSWQPEGKGIWRADIPKQVFGAYNPFTLSPAPTQPERHLGVVYLNNQPLSEQSDRDGVAAKQHAWFSSLRTDTTHIWANFGLDNPNKQVTEITVRGIAFGATKPDINFVTFTGFQVTHIASPPAEIDGAQPGAISTGGGTHWVIQHNTITHISCVAISIGQIGHSYPEAKFSNPAYSDLSRPMEQVGHHLISHNFIQGCGQAGIFGLLHGTASEIYGNQIEDINTNGIFPESAGIRLAVAVDAVIRNNWIRRIGGTGYGIWVGPLYQGIRLSRNVIMETGGSCLYLYQSHGPALVDTNVLSGPGVETGEGIRQVGVEATVFAQNLFYNCGFTNEPLPGKTQSTANYLPHSMVIKQTIPALPIDGKWFSNLFIKGGLDKLAKRPGYTVDYNGYLAGAKPFLGGDEHSKTSSSGGDFRLISRDHSVSIIFNQSARPPVIAPTIDAEFVGFFALTKQYIESPDGHPIALTTDFNGNPAPKGQAVFGPFSTMKPAASGGDVLFQYQAH